MDFRAAADRAIELSFVGIIANPASGKDIRRLVAYGSVSDNQEKVRLVRRVLAGLSAVGVNRICYMPDYFGIVRRALERIWISAEVFDLGFPPEGTQEDSMLAARLMEEQGVDCIVTVGGDGTNRAVAKGNSSVPILPISTGTNNVFPYMVEGTTAGLAAGLVASKRVPAKESTFSSTRLEIIVEGELADLALVDAVVCDDPFVASRAVWNIHKVRQVFLNRAQPESIGFSSIGGLICPVEASEPRALQLELGDGGRPVTAPVAPGVIERVMIKSKSILEPGEEVSIHPGPCTVALDGERELEIRPKQRAAIRLGMAGPIVVHVGQTMAAAAKRRLLAP